MRTWCVVLVAAGLLSVGLAHNGLAGPGSGGHDHDGSDSKRSVPEHCVICPALCLGGLAGALGAMSSARRRSGKRMPHRASALGALVWAWTFDHPPRVA